MKNQTTNQTRYLNTASHKQLNPTLDDFSTLINSLFDTPALNRASNTEMMHTIKNNWTYGFRGN